MVILAFAIVYVVWGSTYFFIQRAITGFPPLLLGAIRFIISGSMMLIWCKAKGQQLFIAEDIKHAAISGFLMLFIGTGAVIWVEQYLPSAMVAIMVSSGPLWFILLDKPKWRENLSNKATVAGLLIGFAGIILLFYENIVSAFSDSGNTVEINGLFILIIGSMAWSGGSLYSKYKSTGNSVAVNSAWQMLAAGIAFFPGSLFRGELNNFNWHTIPTEAWLSLWYLVIFGSIAGFSAYVWLLQVRPAMQVSTHSYVNPVVAVLLGVFFAKENISFLQIAGLIVILISVLMISMVKYRNDQNANKKIVVAIQPLPTEKNEKQIEAIL